MHARLPITLTVFILLCSLISSGQKRTSNDHLLSFADSTKDAYGSHASQTILARAELNKKFGCIDLKGNEVIPLKYDEIGFWGNNLIPVNMGAKDINYLKEGGKWGYCNNQGLLTIPLQFTKAETFNEGIAAVQLHKKWGFIDTSGRMIIAPRYDQVGKFKDGLCAVSIKNKWGYINHKGEEIIRLEYGEAFEFKDNRAVVFIGEKANEDWEEPKGNYCLIDRTGKKLSDAVFKMIWHFSEGLARVEVADTADKYGSKKGYINTKGELVIPPIYDVAEDFSEGLAVVGIKRKTDDRKWFNYNYTYGYINQQGGVVIKIQFSQAAPFFNGRAVVSNGNQRSMGFISIDTRDSSIINHEDWPKYALIDKAGSYILNFDWRHLSPIDSNLYEAQRAMYNGDGVIDIHGTTIVPFNYTNLNYLGDQLLVADDGAGNGGAVQLLTMNNKLLFKTSKFAMPAAKYEYGLLHVRTNRLRKTGFVDINGKWVIKDKYDMVWSFEPTCP